MSKTILILICLIAGLFTPSANPVRALPAPAPRVQILNRSNQETSLIHDGDTITLTLNNAFAPSQDQTVTFFLDTSLTLASCTLQANQTSCSSSPLSALGWYWDLGGVARPNRQVTAQITGYTDPVQPADLAVNPRPFVLVHGFVSTYDGWANYLGPDGFAARSGLQAFAVGDGQVEGTLLTGSITDPRLRTNTIAQNAAVLRQYIEGVKKLTGAEMVDLVGHSMGGMISRAYIDLEMQTRDVSQLIMIGSPMGGSDCANLPAALGFYLPASLEIRPSYMRQIFNLQITHRKGVPFHDLAGTPILEGFKSPCTAVPSDLVVSLDSINAIPLHSAQSPVLHIDMNTSADIFQNYVLPLLQTPAGQIQDEPDAAPSGQSAPASQFSRMFTGSIPAGGSQELTIHIDPGVTVASFALFDLSRSLNVRVRGASGSEITLSPETNGLIVVDDPRLLFYLGYGFNNPKPGAWVVRLEATDRTPAAGTDYALTALFNGGPQLNASALPLLPAFGSEVTLTAALSENGASLPIKQASATILGPDGASQTVDLTAAADGASAAWKPASEGLYAINLYAQAETSDGRRIERTAFLTVNVQPEKPLTNLSLLGLGLACLCALALFGLGIGFLVLRAASKKSR